MEDMDAPVTRGELRKELELTRKDLRAEIEASRGEARTEFAAVRGEMAAGFAAVRAEMVQLRRDIVLDVGVEMTRQFNLAVETMRDFVRALDDQYRELPARVATIEASELPARVANLEAAVFAPPRKRRRKAS